MHVHDHSVAPIPAESGGHDDQGVLPDEIPYASPRLILVLTARGKVELQGRGERDKEEE
jgi:hypothetical protein